MRDAGWVADAALPVQLVCCCWQTDTACRREAVREAGKVVHNRMLLAGCGPLSLIELIRSCRSSQRSSQEI